MPIQLIDDFRERLITSVGPPSDEIWCQGWADFNFCLPGCETSHLAQSRMCLAMEEIAQLTHGVTAVFTHGNVIGLFLNWLMNSFGREATETLKNPDVLKIIRRNGAFTWDSDFRLRGLETIATAHRQTPQEDAADTTESSTLTTISSAVVLNGPSSHSRVA